MQGIDRNLISKTIFVYFLIDQTERMEEHASIMKVQSHFVAIVHHNILVTDVKLIDVILINAKIMGPVMSLSLTTIQ